MKKRFQDIEERGGLSICFQIFFFLYFSSLSFFLFPDSSGSDSDDPDREVSSALFLPGVCLQYIVILLH